MLEHVLAVHHALIVVGGDAVCRAQRDDDGVVGSGQVDVIQAVAGVGRVDDRLALGAIVDLDAGLNGLHVGGIQRQRNVVEVLLQELDAPLHELLAVGLGGANVQIQIGRAGVQLLLGTLEDRLGIALGHGLADDGRDAVNSFTDNDKLAHCSLLLFFLG